MEAEGAWPQDRIFSSGASLPGSPKITNHLALMDKSTLFIGLAQSDCIEIAASGRIRTFARNELLFVQGQLVTDLILLESGMVKHTQLSSQGTEVLLWVSSAGKILNLRTDPPLSRNTCSARAMVRCSALVWEYSRFEALLNRFPRIRQNISQILVGRLQELEERYREVATETVTNRVALTLIRLSKQVGKPTNEGVQIALTREELAQMIGTTLFTVSRVLSRWAQTGFVLPRREAVYIVDPKKVESAFTGGGQAAFELIGGKSTGRCGQR